MNETIRELFEDKKLVARIQNKLPKLFHLAELESSRAGKIGMEVGSVREKVILALFIYKFGEAYVKTKIPITQAEVDVIVHNTPISVKTITGKNLSGVKLIWTVDRVKAREFLHNYHPTCDIVLAQINWNNGGGFFYFPLKVQKDVFKKIGREKYIKLPVEGTNPRGVEISSLGLTGLVDHKNSLKIPIDWTKENIEFKPFQRWLELWQND